MAKVYHTGLSTSFSKHSRIDSRVIQKSVTKVGETCGKLFIPFIIVTIFTFIFSIYIFINLCVRVNNCNLKIWENNFFIKRVLEVHFLNVGQGDAIFIQTKNGNSMLIDSGPQNEKVIAEIQKFKNIFSRDINILLATHADADHIGSMKKVTEKFSFQKFAFSGLGSDTKIFNDLIRAIISQTTGNQTRSLQNKNKNKNKKLLTLTAGMSIVLDSKNDVRFNVLYPDFDFQIEAYKKCRNKNETFKKTGSANSSNFKSRFKVNTKNSCLKFINTETNLNSIVGILKFGKSSFVLTGDAPIEVENFIIKKYGSQIRSDVLKLGHHGSKTSTAPEFLNEVSPDFIVVSAGLNNRYGHPHKIVLDNIDTYKKNKNNRARILRTDMDGTITFEANDLEVFLK